MSSILFKICMSGLIKWTKERVSREDGLSDGNNLRWVATGRNRNQVLEKLDAYPTVSINWTLRP
jgi:hypothetical protein